MGGARARNVVLLGATGSIGRSTLEVIRHAAGRLRLVGIASLRNAAGLEAIGDEFAVPHRSLFSRDGSEGLLRLATLEEADVVVLATTGTVGLQAAAAALDADKTLALASKEILVLAGELFVQHARKAPGRLIPVDSEHSALFQCLLGRDPRSIHQMILTASGGPFLRRTPREMHHITLAEALSHPNWSMGTKITIDSATMANKGLELIEARWLFDLPAERLRVVIHPQSIIHSMVEFVDGSVMAQMGRPSMTLPIQFAIDYPDTAPSPAPRLDFDRIHQLELRPPDLDQFPCLALAMEALHQGGAAPALFNAANQIAVEAFIEKRLPFLAIPGLIRHCLRHNRTRPAQSLADCQRMEAEMLAFARAALDALPEFSTESV